MNQRQEKQQREKVKAKVSAAGWAEKKDTGGRTTYKVPAGVSLLKLDGDGAKNAKLDFFCYRVGKGNPNADEGSVYFERTFFTHANVGPANSIYVCPKRTANKPCPICEERDRIWNDPSLTRDEKKVRTRDMRPKDRQLWLVRNQAEEDKGVQIWEQSLHTFGKFLQNEIQNREDSEDYDLFADPEDGHTVKVTAIVKPLDTGGTFKEFSSIKFIKRAKPLEYDFDDMPCLDDLLIVPTYDFLKKAYFGDEVEEDGDTDGAPVRKSSASANGAAASSRKAKQEEDDDDEDEKQEAPARKSDKSEKPNGLPEWCQEERVVLYNGEKCEVKRVSKDGKSLVLEGEDGDEYRGIDPEDCEPYAKLHKQEKAKSVKSSEPDDEEEEEEPRPRKRK